jgi:hypothetical protein
MSSRSCPDWPTLLELAPELHFKHYSVAEAHLPGEVLVNLPDVPLEAIAICADLEHNVFNQTHTDARVTAALQDTHWYELNTWVREGPPG